MYVYPVLPTVALPDEWAEFAPTADNTYGDALDINANRKDWFAKWSEIFSAN
jgi:thiamine transport system substrate-binding protein